MHKTRSLLGFFFFWDTAVSLRQNCGQAHPSTVSFLMRTTAAHCIFFTELAPRNVENPGTKKVQIGCGESGGMTAGHMLYWLSCAMKRKTRLSHPSHATHPP